MIRLPIGTRYLFMKQRGKARGSGSIYLKKGSGIRVMLHEPKTEPFVMVAKRGQKRIKTVLRVEIGTAGLHVPAKAIKMEES